MRQIQHCLHAAAGYTDFEHYADGTVAVSGVRRRQALRLIKGREVL